MKKVFLMRIPDTTTHIARFEVVGVVFHPRHSLLAGHYRAALRAIASEEGNLCSYYVTDENVPWWRLVVAAQMLTLAVISLVSEGLPVLCD